MHDEETLKKHADILQLAQQARSIEDARDHLDEHMRVVDELSEALETAHEVLGTAISAIEGLDAVVANLAHVDFATLLDEVDKIKNARPEFKLEDRQFGENLESVRAAVAGLEGFVQDMDRAQLKNIEDRLVSLDWNLEKHEDVISQVDRTVGRLYSALWLASYTMPESVACVDMTEVIATEQEYPSSHPVHDLKLAFDDYAETQAVRGGRAFTGEDGHLYLAGTETDIDAEDVNVLGLAGYRRSLHEQESQDWEF